MRELKSKDKRIKIIMKKYDSLTEEEQIEMININQIINQIKENPNKKYSLKQLKKIENAIIKYCRLENNLIYALWFAEAVTSIKTITNYPLDDLEDAIIQDGDYIVRFAEIIPEANIAKLEDAVIRGNNSPNYSNTSKSSIEIDRIYCFARDVKGANLDKLEDAIISEKDPEYIYGFALDLPNTNKKKLEKAIIETKDMEYIELFAENIPNSEMAKKILTMYKACA